MRLVLDAGALIGIDRGDRRVAGLIELGRRSGAELVTSAAVLGQAWRNGARQARLARHLPMIDIRSVTASDARSAGELLGHTDTADIVDALLAQLAGAADQILTSDHDDLGRLVAGRGPSVVRV